MSLSAIENEIAKLRQIAEHIRNVAETPVRRAESLAKNFYNNLTVIHKADANIIAVASGLPEFVRDNLGDLPRIEEKVKALTEAIAGAKESRERLDKTVEFALKSISDAADSVQGHINAQLDE